MHAFHDYISKQLYDHLKKRRVVVWYDPKEEFGPYIEELFANSPEPASSTASSSILPTAHF